MANDTVQVTLKGVIHCGGGGQTVGLSASDPRGKEEEEEEGGYRVRAAAYTPVQDFQTKQPVESCFQSEAGVTLFARAPVPVAVARTSSRPAVGPSFQSALMASVFFWQSGWDDGEG